MKMNMSVDSNTLVKANSDTTDLVTYLYSMRKLQLFIDRMPNGQYFDLHCSNYDRCDAIVIRMDGEVCPVFKNTQCCMNPLLSRSKKRDSSADMSEPAESEAHLSTFSLSGRNFMPNYSQGSENWLKASIDSYNKQVMDDYVETEMMSCLRSFIVTAYEF